MPLLISLSSSPPMESSTHQPKEDEGEGLGVLSDVGLSNHTNRRKQRERERECESESV